MPSGPFFKKVLKSETQVLIDQFNDQGERINQPAIINIIGGHNNGEPEATRLVNLLNEAWTTFHTTN